MCKVCLMKKNLCMFFVLVFISLVFGWLQPFLNGGGRRSSGGSPIVWGYNNSRDVDGVLDRAQAMQTLWELRNKLNQQGDNLDEAGTRLLQQIQISLDQVSKKTTISDAVLRASIGEDAWKDLKNLTTGNEDWIRLGGYVAAIKGAEILGKRVDKALDESLGEPLSSFFSTLVKKFGKGVHYCCDRIVGRKGEPFDYQEVEFWHNSLNKTLLGLEKWARNSGMLGQRDRVARSWSDDEEEETVEQSWKWQRDLYERRLRDIIDRIDKRLEYHKQRMDFQIIEYASQIRDWIFGYLENVLLKTKSHKDLGSSDNRVALANLIEELSNAFSSLLNYLDPNRNKSQLNDFQRRPFYNPRGNYWRMHDDEMGDNG